MKRSLIIAVLISVILTIAAFVVFPDSPGVGIGIGIISLFWHVYYLFDKMRYYKKISELSFNLDLILNNKQKLYLKDYAEGELSILAAGIEKLLTRLNQQQVLLAQDKHFLSNSLADISHQLRTPLASLNLLFDRLKKQNLSKDEQQIIIRDIHRLLNQLERLIDNLLIMSKLDAGAILFKKEKHSLQSIVKKAIEPLEIKLELKEIKIDFQNFGNNQESRNIGDYSNNRSSAKNNYKDSDSEPLIECDLFWTTEAVTNILKNCLEHCGPKGEILIRSYQNPLYTELTIEDNGKGISQKDLPHLFERFYRGENAAPNSIGIGLALSRQIIHDQGGIVKAKNKKTGGALFKIRFYE